MPAFVRINPWTYQDSLGYSQAIKVSGAQLFVSGQTSTDGNGQAIHPGDMAKQAETAMDNLETVLTAADASLSDVAKLTVYVTDVPAFMDGAAGVIARLQRAGNAPAITLIGVAALIDPALMVEIEATAVL